MIGNASPWGSQGYTVLEEGELDPRTMSLSVHHYLVCTPEGEALDERYASMAAARAAIEAREAGFASGR